MSSIRLIDQVSGVLSDSPTRLPVAINGSLDHRAEMTSTLQQRFTRRPAAVSHRPLKARGETTNDLTISSRNIGADDQSTRNGRRRIGDQE